jgi:hypothetical protein
MSNDLWKQQIEGNITSAELEPGSQPKNAARCSKDSTSIHPGVQYAIMKMQIDLAEMRADLVELKMGLDRERFLEKGQQAEEWRGEQEVLHTPIMPSMRWQQHTTIHGVFSGKVSTLTFSHCTRHGTI